MSVACAVVVYRGRPVTKPKLTALIRRTIPTIGAVRHGGDDGLNWIVICDDRSPDVSAKDLAKVNEELPRDAPLGAIVQAAWKLAFPTAQALLNRAVAARASPNGRYDALARELSRVAGTSWVVRRSASRRCIGRRFVGGVETETSRKLPGVLGCQRVELERLLRSACTTATKPPVLLMTPSARAVPFRRSDFERALR